MYAAGIGNASLTIKYGFSGVGNISCLKMVEQCLLDSKMCTLSHIMVDNEIGETKDDDLFDID